MWGNISNVQHNELAVCVCEHARVEWRSQAGWGVVTTQSMLSSAHTHTESREEEGSSVNSILHYQAMNFIDSFVVS